jgi:molybdate transport repressor ModE-like protein
MNWDDARIFLAFAREGSFGAAARRLDVQHSTVSRRIHAMESYLAAPLVERSASGYTLTQAGKTCAPQRYGWKKSFWTLRQKTPAKAMWRLAI